MASSSDSDLLDLDGSGIRHYPIHLQRPTESFPEIIFYFFFCDCILPRSRSIHFPLTSDRPEADRQFVTIFSVIIANDEDEKCVFRSIFNTHPLEVKLDWLLFRATSP